MEINSPITGSSNVKYVKRFLTSEIVSDYEKIFKINIDKYFKGIKEIYLYECGDSKYQFYYPFNIAGDSLFYEQLEKFEWYYMKYKWENHIAEKYIKNGDKVLEIGCAGGDFLKKISSEKNIFVEGLELNNAAVIRAAWQGITAYSDTIENFSKTREGFYDVICSFQVLEHISNPKSMIESSILALKKDGLLVIGAPNNNSFISKDLNPLLNMPPHHMGMYYEETFEKLEKYFSIKLEKIEIEPLQKYHIGYYVYVHVGQYLINFGVLGKIINKMAFILAYPVLRFYSKKIKGHTVVVIYKKI